MPPFEDEPAAEAFDASVQLDKLLLLNALYRLKAAESVPQLREANAELREQVVDQALLARDGEQVTFTLDVLLAELDQIAASQTVERARYYIERLIKGVTDKRTSAINDINLNRWKEYDEILTDSLWTIERRDSTGAHTAGYWGNFIPQIPRQMMWRYTRPGDWVIDTFAGSGTTLIEAQRLGRNSIGVELQPQVAEATRQRIASEMPNRHVTSTIHIGDSATTDYGALLQKHGQQSAHLVLMHPPYFDIIKFSDDTRDLSNAETVDTFLALIGQVVAQVAPVLETGRYLALVIGDKYARGEWIPLGFLTMQEVQKRGFLLKSIIVKNFEGTTGKRQQHELWRYRALVGGFYIFKHEYIFVFRKR